MAFIAKQRYKLDIAPRGGWVIVYASQHDDGAREIEFEITNQGKAFSIPASINVSVQGIKSNGSYFSHSCSYSGNIVTMALADDMTDIIGKSICVLKFTNSSQQKLATTKFVLNVDTDSSSEGIIIDTEAEEIFNQMLNDIRAQAASISADIAELQSMVGSPLVASTVSAMTDHNKIYVYVGSESGYTNGNWYYWNGSAWTSGGVYNAVAFETDTTLSQSGQAADAKVVGDEIEGVKRDLSAYGVAFFDVADSGYIATNVSPNNTVDPTVHSISAFRYTIIQVTEGDKITINGTGWTTGRLWCFTDDNYVVKAVSGQNVIANNLVLTAPSGATKLIINMYATDVGTCYKGVQAVQLDSTLTVAGRAADAKETGDRIEGVKSELETDTGVKHITFTPKYYIATNKAAGTEVDLTPVFNSSFSYSIIPVSEGDQITIRGRGWTTGRLWCFTDDENIVVSVSGKNVIATDGLKLTVPANATKLIINSYTEDLGDCYTGEIVPDIAAKVNSAFVYADSNVIIENETLTENKVFTLNPDRNFYKNIIVTVDAEFTASDTSSPTIHAVRSWLSRDGVHINPYYGSPHYVIGDNGKRKTNQFRFPCGVYGMQNYVFTITVPSGCTLKIHSLSLTYDDFVSRGSFIQLNAHGQCGFGGCPNTNLSFNMAAKLGYKYCITIPKVTSDGVYVCFHDDTGIQGQAKNPDGTDIDSQYHDIPISGFTYNQLLQFDFGILRGMIFKGEKIPLLSDFFKICAETGMHPMLSVHPDLSGHWENIKAMAQKYNVLDKLNIKAPAGSTLTAPMSVLLNDVESYTVDINNSTTDAVEYMDGLVSTYNINKSKVKVGIEYFVSYATDEKIASALNNGYFVSVANITSDVYNQYASFIEKGVTQFTDDYMPCVGLNWY